MSAACINVAAMYLGSKTVNLGHSSQNVRVFIFTILSYSPLVFTIFISRYTLIRKAQVICLISYKRNSVSQKRIHTCSHYCSMLCFYHVRTFYKVQYLLLFFKSVLVSCIQATRMPLQMWWVLGSVVQKVYGLGR